MKKIFFVLALFLVASCTKDMPELDSPCVGAEGSPCVKRKPLLNNA